MINNNITIIDEYRWRNNYAVLYQDEHGKYSLDANNLRCVITLFSMCPSFPAFPLELFEEYTGIRRDIAAHTTHKSGRGIIDSKKHPVIIECKELEKSREGFIIEGERLVGRAIDDRLMLKSIIYTAKSPLEKNGYIERADCPCYLSTEGIIASVTSSKPVPTEIAVCVMPQYSIDTVLRGEYTSLLITDCVNNPDNLGLVIRTADACGVDAVIVTGAGAAPYHKNCVRASRGAIGRLPVLYYPDSEPVIAELKSRGVMIIGTDIAATTEICDAVAPKKFAAVVGNETLGMSDKMRGNCDMMLKIDMPRGQSSFNVAVAAGITLHRLIDTVSLEKVDFDNLTEGEKTSVIQAELEYSRGETIKHEDIDWS